MTTPTESLSDRLKSWGLAAWDYFVDRPKLVEVVAEAPNQAIADRAAGSVGKSVSYVTTAITPLIIPAVVVFGAVLAYYYLKGRFSR